MPNPTPYIPDPILQQLDPLPQPYRMISNMVDDLFSNIFEKITQEETRKKNVGTLAKGGTHLATGSIPNNTSHVTVYTRPSSLKTQKTIFSHEKMKIEDAICLGVTKAPLTRDSIQVGSSERWIVTSEQKGNLYVLRRNKVLWNAREHPGAAPDIDWSQMRCVADLISVFAGVVEKNGKQELSVWIYSENESDDDVSRSGATASSSTGPQLNLLAQITPQTTTPYRIGKVQLSQDGRYVCFETIPTDDSNTPMTLSLYKLPNYKKFVGEPLPFTSNAIKKSGPASVVSGASSARRSTGGRRVAASSTAGTSTKSGGKKATGPTLKPTIQMAMWDTDRFQEPQLLLELNHTDFWTHNSPTQHSPNPQVAFLSNDHLVKHVTTTNSVYRLYNENAIRKSHTKSLLVYYKHTNLLRQYNLERYYHDTSSPLSPTQCRQYTFVDGISCVSVSDESDHFAVGLVNGNVILFDTKSGSSVYLPESHSAMVTSMSFTSFGELITGSVDGDVRVFSIDGTGEENGFSAGEGGHFQPSSHSSTPHTSTSHLITNVQSYKLAQQRDNTAPPQKIINITAARETNLFWCCTNQHVDVLDANGCSLCTIPLKNLNCLRYFGSGHTFIASSDCLMKEKHGFFVFEMLDAVLLAYPEIENQFPAVHNSESAAREVYEFVRCTPHSLRNDSDAINRFLSSPTSLLSPLLSRQPTRRGLYGMQSTTSALQSAVTSRATTTVGGKRPKSKGVSFGAPSEADTTHYVSLASLTRKNPNQFENPIQRSTMRVEQSKRSRRKRLMQRQAAAT